MEDTVPVTGERIAMTDCAHIAYLYCTVVSMPEVLVIQCPMIHHRPHTHPSL